MYNPDLLLGKDVNGLTHFLELKEWMTEADVAKYAAVLESNTHIVLHFLIYDAPKKVFIRLAQLPRCIVQQGFAIIPEEWLEYAQPTHTTRIVVPFDTSDGVGRTLQPTEPPAVRSLQRKHRNHNQ